VSVRIYQVEFTARALRDLAAVPETARRRLAPRIEALGQKPRPPGSKRLAGDEDLYRLRVGDLRVLYEIRDRVLVVLVVRIGHRRDVYRR
jgi:mRNA interferase RelE/StbE